jgi:hypothetical protein
MRRDRVKETRLWNPDEHEHDRCWFDEGKDFVSRKILTGKKLEVAETRSA